MNRVSFSYGVKALSLMFTTMFALLLGCIVLGTAIACVVDLFSTPKGVHLS